MILPHLRIALRTLRRQPGYAAVNVLGLAAGVACCLLILHFVHDEVAYDRFHENGDRIYRLVSEGDYHTVGWPYGRILEEEFPEVEEVVYMRSWPTWAVLHEGERHYERVRYADERFFRVFDFPMLEGDRSTALTDPYSLVITDAFAEKLFGSASALGRTVTIGDTIAVTVTGVAQVPRQSHIQFDALLSFATLGSLFPQMVERSFASGWLDLNVINYVLLREGADAGALAARIRDLPQDRAPEVMEAFGSDLHLALEPLRSIYLRSDLGSGLGPAGDISYVYLLSLAGLLILLLAGVNFVNLATSDAASRAREVGVRKSIGASRGSLVGQFLAESTLTSFVAVLAGAAIAWLALPYFSELAERAYARADLLAPTQLAALLALVALIGLMAGMYPALAMSRFNPVEALRGRFASGRDGSRLRKGLVVFQFGITSLLLVGTLTVLHQLRYMESRPLGFSGDQVVVVDGRRAPDLSPRREAFKEALQAHAGVQRVALSYAVPGRSGWAGQLSFPEGMGEGQSVSLEYIVVDHDYVETIGLEVIAGRDFDRARPADDQQAVIVNEAAVAAAGWASAEEAIGRRYTSPGSGKPDGVVIGVVRDHHHHGLRSSIGPIMYGIESWALGFVSLRVAPGSVTDVVAHLEDTWEAFFPDYTFTHALLDEGFAAQYAQERRLARIFGTFTGLAILVACLGLFALTSFTVRQRTREVGVRKVLGATVASIVTLLARDFVWLVLLGFALAAPLAYWGMNRWLENFAYHAPLGPGIFLLAASGALLIAVLTVAFHTVRGATADPVRSLRAE